jgi:glycosyltransferase involved in cell wall biosynthesis
MPSLLLLCEYAALNGGERSMLATLDGVRQAGFRPAVAAPPHGPLADALRSAGVEVVTFEAVDSTGRRRSLVQLREELAVLIARRRPDLLHANSLAMGRLSGPVAAELGVRSVAHLRDIVKLSAQATADLNRHRRLLAVSQAVAQFHVAAGRDAEKVHVLYNGVDLEQFRPATPTGYLHRELGIPPGAPLVATIGQISLRKGHDILLRAFEPFAGRTAARLLVIGQRHSAKEETLRHEAELFRLAGEALAGRVFFLGPRDDVDRILGELTLLVHPARQEPLGRVLLEAAAAGVPVIASDVGGTREIFPPQCQAARLVPANDVPALATAIEDLLGDAAARRQLGIAARRRAEECFGRETATAGLIEHYRRLLV